MNEPFGIVPHGTSRFELQGRSQRVAVVDTLPDATLFAAAPALHAALRNLVGADNCNYDRHAMRYEGYFDQARAALELATGERLPHPDGPQTGKSIFVIIEEREARMAQLETERDQMKGIVQAFLRAWDSERLDDVEETIQRLIPVVRNARAALASNPSQV